MWCAVSVCIVLGTLYVGIIYEALHLRDWFEVAYFFLLWYQIQIIIQHPLPNGTLNGLWRSIFPHEQSWVTANRLWIHKPPLLYWHFRRLHLFQRMYWRLTDTKISTFVVVVAWILAEPERNATGEAERSCIKIFYEQKKKKQKKKEEAHWIFVLAEWCSNCLANGQCHYVMGKALECSLMQQNGVPLLRLDRSASVSGANFALYMSQTFIQLAPSN